MVSPRILVVIPAYNCAPQIGRVLAQFTPDVTAQLAQVLVIDNRSEDDTVRAALAAAARVRGVPVTVQRNAANYGLGGSHKVGFEHAIREGMDWVVILHGDDQGRLTDLLPQVDPAHRDGQDVLLGSRFMSGSHLVGYSRLRTAGNRIFNVLLSIACRRRVHDLGAGLNAYRVSLLASRFYERFSDDLSFNVYMLMSHVAWRHRIRWIPISWREEDQRSNVRLVTQAMRQLRMFVAFAFGRVAFLRREHRSIAVPAYHSAPVLDGGTR